MKNNTSSKRSPVALSYQSRILKALLALMEKDFYQKLTVTQICQEAGIARQTFYHHFRDKNDVLRWYLRRQFERYVKRNPDTGSGKENIRRLFASFPIPDKILLLLKKHGVMYILQESMLNFVEQSRERFAFVSFPGNGKYRYYESRYIAAVLCTVIECRIERSFQESPEELAQLASYMLKT